MTTYTVTSYSVTDDGYDDVYTLCADADADETYLWVSGNTDLTLTVEGSDGTVSDGTSWQYRYENENS